MDEILEKLEQTDNLLERIYVRGDDAIRMVRARSIMGEAYSQLRAYLLDSAVPTAQSEKGGRTDAASGAER